MATETLTLTVSLKVPDNEARSALEALRVKMRLGDVIRDLVREEVWEFSLEPEAQVEKRIRQIADTTNLLANPNKHRHVLAPGSACDVTLSADQLAILVSDREGAEGVSMAASLRRLGAEGVSEVRRWVRWRLTLTSAVENSEPGLTTLLRKIAVADAREGGLFCNPHIEEARAVLPWGEEKRLAR